MGVKPTVVSIKKYHDLKNQLKQALDRNAELNVIMEFYERPLPIRKELSWFAGECEKELCYHDPVKSNSYKSLPIDELQKRLMGLLPGIVFVTKNSDHYNAVIRHAVKIANYSMMIAYRAAMTNGEFPLK